VASASAQFFAGLPVGHYGLDIAKNSTRSLKTLAEIVPNLGKVAKSKAFCHIQGFSVLPK